MITFKNPIQFVKEKMNAMRAARHAGTAREFAEMKGNGAPNTYVPAKERARRKKRKKIADQSRRRNRK
ncbi:hypothetical protein KHA94_00375 [Bacillus sp. FJAT-49705]|uniref:Uncharacterized protein n=1 Tax=Cytobacillus citreus TaxID=2833586 RepID=A0ABS5NLJ0_9BACI|nr:hypothetical protein [Cytobacillus citreus]MBS4188675.1 hypothetical protein [Cytobacillus citreus]